MKARGVGSLMALLISGVLGVMTMRSCQGSPASAPSNPTNVARTGTAAICANSQAVADAGSPDDSVAPVTLPPDLAAKLAAADPAAAGIVGQAQHCPADQASP